MKKVMTKSSNVRSAVKGSVDARDVSSEPTKIAKKNIQVKAGIKAGILGDVVNGTLGGTLGGGKGGLL